MKKYIVYTDNSEKSFGDMNLAIGYMNQMVKPGEKGEFHLTVKDVEEVNCSKSEITAIEHELKDMIGTFKMYQKNYSDFMKSCHKIMADMQIKLYNLTNKEDVE